MAEAFSSAVFSHFSSTCTPVDVTFDRYRKSSIKSGTRTKRAGAQSKPIRRIIENKDVSLPQNWKQFMDHSDNKADLANFLSEDLIQTAKNTQQTGELITSGGFVEETSAAASHGTNVHHLQSTHEEADTRIILHAMAACQNGFERLIICCRDTDVLVLLVHFASQLSQEIWFRTGTAKQRTFVAVHEVTLPESMKKNLPGFHALTRCDTVSQPRGHGKRTSWKTFQEHGYLLQDLGHGTLSEATIQQVEQFICKVYCPGTNEASINDLRFKLFQKGTKELESLPPTQKSLHLHIKRAHYQSKVWYLAGVPKPELVLPIGDGWYQDETTELLKPQLLMDDPVPPSFTDIVNCKCKTCNTARCTCRSKALRCTAACGCNDLCLNVFNCTSDEESETEN